MQKQWSVVLKSKYAKTMICGVAINSLEITLILQQARSDVKIGPDRAHGNRLNFIIY